MVFLFQPAFDSEVCQDRHHLSDWDPRQLRSPPERGLSVLVSLDSEQDSSARDHVSNGFGQITPSSLVIS